MTSEELLGKAERQQLGADEAIKFVADQQNLSIAVRYNVASAQAVRGEEKAAVDTLEKALARANRARKRQVTKEAFGDPTFKKIWAGEDGEALEDRLRAGAGMPPLSRFQKQQRKMGCLGRH